MNSEQRIGVLFVCLGNICRSPLAKWIFTDLTLRRGVRDRFEIDSCGTGHWHVGKGADPRSVATALRRGIDATHTARRLQPESDFTRFDYLLAMDTDNRENLLHAGAPADRVFLMRSFDPALQEEPEHRLVVPDPSMHKFVHTIHKYSCPSTSGSFRNSCSSPSTVRIWSSTSFAAA